MKEQQEKYNLPESWVWTTVEQLGVVTSGGTPSTKESKYWNGKISWISPADLSGYKEKYISKGKKSITQEGLEESSAKLLPEGSILFSSRAPIGYVAIAKNELATNQGFKNLIPAKSVNKDYIYYYLKSAKQLAESVASGTTFLELSGTKFSKLPVPLPPLNEQARIASKLEESFSELDHGIKNLELASLQLKVYRQVILQQAYEGSLTENWRKENKLEPASKLLKQIKKEVQIWYKQEIENWEKEVLEWEKKGKVEERPTKPKAKKDPYILLNEDKSDLPKVPKEWDWTPLESFTSISGGVTKGKRYGNIDTIELPYLSVANVQDGYFDLSQIKNIRIAHNESKKYQLKYGDILYTEGGDKDKLGRGAMWRGEINNCIHQNHVFRARILANEVNPVFCALFSRTKVAKDYFYRNAKQTTNLASISLKVLSRLPFPLPSRAEQDLIVDIIESRFSLIENLENTINAGLTDCQSLKHSLLKMAFNGNLVPQNSGDIPANVLLDKIAIERKEFVIAEKQRRTSFKPVDKSRRKMDKQLKEIIDLLKESSGPIRTKDLWEDSIYKDDIDAFYAALKIYLEEGVIAELPRQGRESYIKLADKR